MTRGMNWKNRKKIGYCAHIESSRPGENVQAIILIIINKRVGFCVSLAHNYELCVFVQLTGVKRVMSRHTFWSSKFDEAYCKYYSGFIEDSGGGWMMVGESQYWLYRVFLVTERFLDWMVESTFPTTFFSSLCFLKQLLLPIFSFLVVVFKILQGSHSIHQSIIGDRPDDMTKKKESKV